MGFTPTISDPCVYTKGYSNTYCMITLFVDDLIITGPSKATLDQVRNNLKTAFSMSDLGPVTQILEIDIDYDRQAGIIKLSQGKYTTAMLKRFNMDNCNTIHTAGIGPELSSQSDDCVLLDEKGIKEYQSIVGSLIFLTVCTRYDIAFSTMQAARHMSTPNNAHLGAIKRILRYLQGKPDLPIVYKRESTFRLRDYCDASYASGDPDKNAAQLDP